MSGADRSMFRSNPWYRSDGPHRYIANILMELGRLGLTEDAIEHHGRQPRTVLSDLMSWLETRGNEHHLYEWQNFNFDTLSRRQQEEDQRNSSKQFIKVQPRIEIFAEITKIGNLSVWWHPSGMGETVFWDSSGSERGSPKGFDYRDPRRFIGKEYDSDFIMFGVGGNGAWGERPINEIMFIHGVSSLYPHRANTLNDLLIRATKATYEMLIDRLKETFEVTVRTVFDLTEENDHIISWSLEDPQEIARRTYQKRFDSIEVDFGFPVSLLDEEFRIASLPNKEGAEPPKRNAIIQKLARNLKKAGYSITPSKVDDLLSLIGRVRSHG